jgi:hypothetical protein
MEILPWIVALLVGIALGALLMSLFVKGRHGAELATAQERVRLLEAQTMEATAQVRDMQQTLSAAMQEQAATSARAESRIKGRD